jgi:hypothetical protein
MAGEIPTIEQLEKDIVEKPQQEWEQTVKKWHEGQLEKIRTGKYDDAAKKRLTEELNSARDKMVEDAKYAREKHDKKYSDGIAIARSFLEQTKKELESVISPGQIDHQKKFVETRRDMQARTAPTDSFIPDYEGWSLTGEGLTDENANNKTRWTLSGYLTALQIVDQAKADDEIKHAKELYEKPDWGRAFEYKHLREDMGLGKYMGPLESFCTAQGFELSGESMGLLCGYLKISETVNPADSEKYSQYLYGMLGELKARLKYDPSGEKDYMVDFNRAVKQMPVLMELKNPKEWAEKSTEENKKVETFRKDFETMKKSAVAISEGLKFSYEDTGVRTLLVLEPEQIGAADEAAIKNAKEAIRTEAFLKIEEAYKKAYPGLGELQTRIGDIETKNGTVKALAEQEVADVKTRVTTSKESYDTIELSKDDPLDVLAQISGILVSVASENEALKKKMDEMEETLKKAPAGGGAGGVGGAGGTGGGKETPGTSGPDKYLDQWSKAEAVNGRFKTRNLRVSPNIPDAVYRDDNGKILGKIPGTTPVTLLELPSRGRKIGEVVFVQVTYENKQVWVDEGMLEAMDTGAGGGAGGAEKTPESAEISEFLAVKNLKEVPNGNSVWYQLGDPKDVPLSPGSQVMSSGNHEVDSLFLQNYVFKKMSAEEAARVNKLFNEARYASQFSILSGVPTAAKLKIAYDLLFKRVWEYVGKNGKIPGSLSDIGIPGGAAPGAAGENPGSIYRGEVPAGLADFAREYTVHAEFREALVRMARDGEKPEGAMFDIQFNNKTLPCRLTKASPANYVINWDTGSWSYGSLKEAMAAVNEGTLVGGMTHSALRNPSYYKVYESWSGKLKESRLGTTTVPNEIQFELDWLGTRRAKGNPVVTATAHPFGGISYTIYRDDVGLRGENWRKGFAANFGDMMRQLGHIRRWAQEEDFEKGALAYAKEYNFSILSDSRNYYAAEAMIGRPLSFGIKSYDRKAEGLRGRDSEAATASYGREMVQLGLDWGGTGVADKKGNGWVNLWVNEAGTLSYTVACPSRGVNNAERRVSSMAEIFRDLAEIRKSGGAA